MKTKKWSSIFWLATIFAGLLAVYITLSARALNLDGLGYAGRLISGDPSKIYLPGHLLYGPIMLAIYKAAAYFTPEADIARVMQISDSVFGAAGVVIFIRALQLLGVSKFTSICAGFLLAFSYTYWIHSTDLTTYAFSTFCIIFAFYILCRARSEDKGVPVYPLAIIVTLATLIHQSNILFIPAGVVGIWQLGQVRRLWRVTQFVIASILLIMIPYALLGPVATGSHSPEKIAKWAAGSSHGYKAQFEPMNLVTGVYGFANAVLYLDDIGTSLKGKINNVGNVTISKHKLIEFGEKSAFLLALLIGSTIALFSRKPHVSPWYTWAMLVCVVWIIPYIAFALIYFTTDHDRWIMLLPAVWTIFALIFSSPSRLGKYTLGAVVVVLFGLNLASGIYPAHLGINNRFYMEAQSLEPHLVGSDLVLFWGHDHIGTPGYLRQAKEIQAQHIFDLVLNQGKKRGLSSLTKMVDSAISENRRVVIIGLYGFGNSASDYHSEAHKLGLSRREAIIALDSFVVHPLFRINGETVYYFSGRRAKAKIQVSTVENEREQQ